MNFLHGNTVFLSIGGNMGDRRQLLTLAASLLSEKVGQIVKTSAIYETEPWGFIADNNFLNQVLELQTTLNPFQLLDICRLIESSLGRIRNTSKAYQSRTMDIDILLYDSLIINTDDLKIPHPFMQERLFVLKPLAELAPGLVHPVFKKTIEQLLTECTDTSVVTIYKD